MILIQNEDNRGKLWLDARRILHLFAATARDVVS